MKNILSFSVIAAVMLASCNGGGGTQKEAQDFIDTYTKEYVKLYTNEQEAQWKSNTEIKKDDSSNTLAAQKAEARKAEAQKAEDSAREKDRKLAADAKAKTAAGNETIVLKAPPGVAPNPDKSQPEKQLAALPPAAQTTPQATAGDEESVTRSFAKARGTMPFPVAGSTAMRLAGSPARRQRSSRVWVRFGSSVITARRLLRVCASWAWSFGTRSSRSAGYGCT